MRGRASAVLLFLASCDRVFGVNRVLLEADAGVGCFDPSLGEDEDMDGIVACRLDADGRSITAANPAPLTGGIETYGFVSNNATTTIDSVTVIESN